MRRVGNVLAVLLLSISLPSSLRAAVLENPTAGSFQSGIGLIRGWACEANQIDIVLDDSITLQAAYGTSRGDTKTACGNNTNTGFGLTMNWNLFSSGLHTVRALVDGQQFGSASFTVTNLGQQFLTGVAKNAVLEDFPQQGKSTQLQWQESAQNFVIAAVSDNTPFVSIENNVNAGTTRTVFTVPAGQRLVITDIIIANPTASASCCAQILRGNNLATSSISVPAGSSFQHTFGSEIEFTAGDQVRVQNGAGSGSFNFYLSGFLTNP
ncbi:MAG: hypothetical protein HY268_05185 [Deltaproteobacteria bacterium]|nr:hypothetical protein [Deltaproteobacteria bacterium]